MDRDEVRVTQCRAVDGVIGTVDYGGYNDPKCSPLWSGF